jgi:hypothetical protein
MIVNENLRGVPLLLLANKQDLPGKIKKQLSLNKRFKLYANEMTLPLPMFNSTRPISHDVNKNNFASDFQLNGKREVLNAIFI